MSQVYVALSNVQEKVCLTELQLLWRKEMEPKLQSVNSNNCRITKSLT